ncbi:unnamed protein product [Symbiodinium natans]|uniref:Protein kinase domain-containing protein n=1 Tax=Symbiodinium natans TaxID=878477 RepID=A0A812ILU6_9DINO|nr:unnamed protein product [Symbiodinium natans]
MQEALADHRDITRSPVLSQPACDEASASGDTPRASAPGYGKGSRYEFLSGGDVFQRLHRCHCGQHGFPWHERLSVLLDAASGLSHMHNATPKAFHRDIKSANILLDRHGTAKMADFGLSCISQSGAANITVKTIGGTPGYKCPVYERTRRCTESSEVYSFGMVMLEMMTGLDPSATDPLAPRGIAFPIAKTVAPNTPGDLQRLQRSGDATASWPWSLFEELAPVALRSVYCPAEEKRPTFVELVRLLKSAVERFPPGSVSKQMDMTQASTGSDAHGPCTPRTSQAAFAVNRPPATPCTPPDVRQHHASSPSPQATPPRFGEDRLDEPEATFMLELVESAGCRPEDLPIEQRRLLLQPQGFSAGLLSADVGRHSQGGLLEAWLPDSQQRACISRRALQISWASKCEDVTILSHGTNPLLVDGILLPRGCSTTLKAGSEITFRYELCVLLRLRFVAAVAQEVKPAKLQAASMSRLAEEFSEARNGATVPGVCRAHGPTEVERLRENTASTEDCEAEDVVAKLRCTKAEGLHKGYLAALPSSLRDVALHAGRNLVGRHYQQQLFEALLCPLERLNVSHCHLWLDVVPKHSGHAMRVTNLSSTLEIFVGEEHVPKDRTACLQDGEVLSFAKRNGSGFLHLLAFQAQAKNPADAGEQPRQPVAIAVSGRAEPLPLAREVKAYGSTPSTPPRPSPQGWTTSEDTAGSSPAVVLELSGAGTKDLPAEKRRLGPMTLRKGPWIMGRRHQREFLQTVVKEDCIDFVSRDHFAIAFEDGAFFLLALSQNRIWLDAGKDLGTRSLHRDEMLLLKPGGRILLGTSEAGTAESLRLCWRFDLADNLPQLPEPSDSQAMQVHDNA